MQISGYKNRSIKQVNTRSHDFYSRTYDFKIMDRASHILAFNREKKTEIIIPFLSVDYIVLEPLQGEQKSET